MCQTSGSLEENMKNKRKSALINDISYLINKWENSNKPVIKTKRENQNSCTSYASSKNYA